jgi:Flp pilus assembly pilin Flp
VTRPYVHATSPAPTPEFDRRSRFGRDERGAAMVEFALVLPLLAILLFGMIDFGRAFNYWIDQTHLANEAARWSVVDWAPPGGVSIESYVHNQIVTPELKTGGSVSGPTTGATVCVSFPGKTLATAAVGDPVKVAVASDFRFLALLGLAQVNLKGEATMRLEAKPTAAKHEGDLCYP